MTQQQSEPEAVEGFADGADVEHRLMPGFVMKVQGRRPCETDGIHPREHPAYLVQDPEGANDFVCHYDVQEPGAGLQWGEPE